MSQWKRGETMSFRIMSFNVHNLSLATGRDIERIRKIIADNSVDIVAMQEVLAEGRPLKGFGSQNAEASSADRYLKALLGRNWEVSWAYPLVHAKNYPYLGKDNRQEGYAFLWNTDKFELPLDENGEAIRPKIFTNYHVNRGSESLDGGKNLEKQIRLIRDPYYGRFKVKGRPTEIRLISTHIVFNKPQDDKLAAQLDYGAAGMRRHEFNILAGKIYPRISEYYKDVNCTAPYTIILGDYNLNLKSRDKRTYSIDEYAVFDKNGHLIPKGSANTYCIIRTVQDQLTTLKVDEPGYANNYDHFSFDDRTSKEVSKDSWKRVEAVSPSGSATPSDADFETYRKEVSDHLPIIIDINI